MAKNSGRRRFLKATGAAGIVGIAGCSSGGGGDTTTTTSSSGGGGNESTTTTSSSGGGTSGSVELITVIGYPQSGAQLFRDYYKQNDNVKILIPDGLRDGGLPGQVGNPMSNVTGTAPAAGGPNQAAFTKLFKDQYNNPPGVFTSQSYDSAAILILANVAAGANDGPKIRDQMRRVTNPEGDEYGPSNFVDAVKAVSEGKDINYQGASSSTNFDKNGDPASATYDIWKFDSSADGNIKTVDSVDFKGSTPNGAGPMADSSPGGTDRTVSLGILLPTTGDLGSTGKPMVQAAKIPAKQVNDAKIGIEVDVNVQDTQTNPSAAISAANSMVNAGVPAICGTASSGVNIPVSKQVLIPNKVVGCSPSSTALTVSHLDDNDFIFRTAPSDLLQGQVMAQVASKRLETSVASTLYVNNDYGQQLSNQFTGTYQGRFDGKVLSQVAFNKGESSYTSVINKALQK